MCTCRLSLSCVHVSILICLQYCITISSHRPLWLGNRGTNWSIVIKHTYERMGHAACSLWGWFLWKYWKKTCATISVSAIDCWHLESLKVGSTSFWGYVSQTKTIWMHLQRIGVSSYAYLMVPTCTCELSWWCFLILGPVLCNTTC